MASIKLQFKALLVLCFLVHTSRAHAAVMNLDLIPSECYELSISIDGPIVNGDTERFKALAGQLASVVKRVYSECRTQPQVILDSRGGDVDESLAIGRLIRAAPLRTFVRKGSECFSSCVFLLAAGVEREAYGKVAIHRPYFSNIPEGKDINEIRTARANQIRKISAYLESMDTSQSLIDAMTLVPPEKLRFLSRSESQLYRLIGEDPSHEEYRVNRWAKLYGLSTAAYRQRSVGVYERCERSFKGETNICVNAEILGISIAEAEVRWDRLQSCNKKSKNETFRDDCFRKYMVAGER